MQPETQTPPQQTAEVPTSVSDTLAPSGSTQPGVNFKSGIYWRKSRWNGLQCVPVILTLENESLQMTDRDGKVVFQAPLSSVMAHFTGLGIMKLVVKGQHYAFAGAGASVSPGFSSLQKQELHHADRSTDMQRAAATAMAIGAVGEISGAQNVAIGGEALGVGLETAAIYSREKVTNAWLDVFKQAGVPVSGGKGHALRYVFISIAVIIVLFLILAAIVGAASGQ